MNEELRDPFSNTRVGIVVSQLLLQGGAEEVSQTLAEEFNAPLYTLYYDPQRFDEEFHENIKPRVRRIVDDEYLDIEQEANRAFHDGFLPQTPVPAFGRFDRSNIVDSDKVYADVLIALDTKGARICSKFDTPYISYMHHPGKTFSDYFWDVFDKKPGMKGKLKWLYDRTKESRRVKTGVESADIILTNSERTRQRTNEVWGTPLDRMRVVYPPVDTEFLTPGSVNQRNAFSISDRYFLAAQRLEPYKNLHILIEAAKRSREHLVITGAGTMEDFVRREAQYSQYVHCLGYMDPEGLRDLYRGAEAVLQGAMREDFGLVPPESMACGTPAIAPASGGFLESIGDGFVESPEAPRRTDYGYLLDPEEFTPETVGRALQNFDRTNYDEKALRSRAEQFSRERFFDEVESAVTEIL